MEDKPPDTKGKGATKGKYRYRPAAEVGHHPANISEVQNQLTKKDKKLRDTKNKETTTGKTSGAGGDRCSHSGDEQNTSKDTNSGAKSKATSVTDKDTAVGHPLQIEWKGSPSQKPRRPIGITILYIHAGKECTLQIENDCDLETYLKWQFVLHNPRIFASQARKVQETLNIKVCIENGRLLLDVCDLKIRPDTDSLIDSVNFVFTKVFDQIFVYSFPTHGVSASEVVQELKKTDLGKKHELYVECIDKTVPSLVYVVCLHAMRKETELLTTDTVRLVSGFCSKVLRLPLVFKEVFDKHKVLEMLTQKTKNLMVECEEQYENNEFFIMMKGNKCDVELAEKLATEKHQQYGYGVVSFTDIQGSARFENISEMIEKYINAYNLKLFEQIKTEIIVYINETAKKVGICADNQQLVDHFIQAIKRQFFLQKVPLTGKLSRVSEQDLIKVISEKLKDYSEYVIASIDENDKVAKLFGFEEDVKKVEKILQQEMNPVQDKVEKFVIKPVDKGSTATKYTAKGKENGENIQDQDKIKDVKKLVGIQSIYVFQYLLDKVKIDKIGHRFSVKIVEVKNETRQGFLLAGGQACITKVEHALRELEESIMSETVHLNYSCTDQNRFVEVVHNIEREKDILIKKLDTNEKLEGAGIDTSHDAQEADCECVEDTKWTFPGGHMVVITNGSAQEYWEHMLVDIQVSEDSLKASNAVTSHGEDKKCIVLHIPAWYNGERKEKDIMRDAVMKMMKETQTYESTHVCIPLEPKGKWLFSLFAKGILVPVVEHLADINILPVKVQLCTPDIKSYRTCCEIAENVMKMSEGCKEEDKTNVNKIRTTIMKGELNKQKADVIVNTTSANLNLSNGRVSSALSKTAGPELQAACKKKYPYGIKSGEIAETPGFKLPCRYVFHGAIDSYTGSSSVENMQTFVFDCLKKAAALQQKTISFPAIGTGNLSYPKDMVAAAMFAAVYEFDMKYKGSSLEEVLFVIYQKDYDTIKEFEKVERESRQSGCQQAKCAIKNSRHRSKALLFREVRVSARLGCLEDSEADAVIYLWEKRKKFSANYQNEGILKVAGADVLRKFESLRKLGTFSTPGGNLKVREIIHVTCEDSLDSIVKALEDGISEVDKRHMKSTIVFFPMTHPFVRYGKKLAESLVTATSKMAPFLKHLKDISIVVQGQPNFQAIFQYFESCNQPSSAEQLHVTLQITGPSKEVEQSKQQLKEKLGAQILVQDPVMEAAGPFDLVAPGEQKIDGRDGASDEPSGLARQLSTTDDKWNRDSLKEDKELNRYVEIENIPAGTTVDKLKSLLFVRGFPIAPPQLVFTDGMVKAIVICQGGGDAVKLSQFTGIPVLKFEHLENQSLGSFTQKLDAKLLKVAHQKKEYKSLVDELLAIEVNLANDIIKTQTSIQLQCAEAIVASYCERLGVCTRKKTHSEFEHVANTETVSGVSVLIWDIVRTVKAKEIKEIKSRNGSVEMDSKTSCITIIILNTSDDDMAHAAVVKSFAESIKRNDIDEIEIDAKDAADAPKWCKEIQETLNNTGSFCRFIPDDKKVVACCETYDDILKIKHQFLIKQGKVKPTARGGRGRRVLDSEPSTSDNKSSQQQSSDICYGKHSDFDWEREASLVKKYQTAEGIVVCVYKASIVKLPVDCIVNAANATLQHGGGVAKVIADAAGRKLTIEGDDYRRRYGNIPVGQVCSTTAGRLPYACVIHTVGPRWYDYTPHTLVEVKRCEEDLYSAIYKCFMEAEKKNLTSIALPAVSAAIFGVPEEFCVYHYAKATLDYSKRSSASSRLNEIHFIDINPNIIRKIQDAFEDMLHGKSDYDVQTFVKQQPYRRHNSPSQQYNYNENSDRSGRNKNMQGSQAVGGSNSASNYATNQCDEQNLPPTSGISQFAITPDSQDNEKYIVRFRSSEEPTLVLWKTNILSVQASAVVSVEDTKGTGRGKVAELIAKRISSITVSQYSSEKKRVFSQNTYIGDVLVTKGYDSGYGHIFHVVLAANVVGSIMIKDRIKILGSTYDKILKLADDYENIKSLVMPLVGTGAETKDDVKASADAFIDSYRVFCNRKLQKSTSRPLTVNLVFREQTNLSLVLSILEKQISDGQLRPVTVPPRPSQPPQNYPPKMTDEKSLGADAEGDCVICMDSLTNPKKLDCGHMFCKACIDQQFQHKKACPTCGKVCGIITGDQPKGFMNVRTDEYWHCEGYYKCGRIQITYKFYDGMQGQNHPAPGKKYKGIERKAYLPDNYEGKQILAMLRVAFNRKLVFTIGNSRTTGEEGVITWNDIHHKTNPLPNTQFGYPDETYLTRVKDELAAKGITEDDIK